MQYTRRLRIEMLEPRLPMSADTVAEVIVDASQMTTEEPQPRHHVRCEDFFAVALNTQPTADVTINIESSDPSEGIVHPTQIVITPEKWDGVKVGVRGVDDAVLDGDVVWYVITHPAVSDDPAYHGIDPPDVQVTNRDNEPAYGRMVAMVMASMNTQPTRPIHKRDRLLPLSYYDLVLLLRQQDEP